MSDKIIEANEVEILRLKTEVADMDKYLRKKLGGYTKESVLEYLNALRKQHQSMSDTFSSNMQTLYNEKEALNKENEMLQYELNKSETEYKNLSDLMTGAQIEESNFTLDDVIALQKKGAAQEEASIKCCNDKASLENQIKHLNDSNSELLEKQKVYELEITGLNGLIVTKGQEIKELREKVVELTITIEDKLDEVKYLRAIQSEGKISELTLQVNQLTAQIIMQTEVLERLNAEAATKIHTIESLTSETEMQRRIMIDLDKRIEELGKQNEISMLTNAVFTKQLQDNCNNTIDLIIEKSEITISKNVANRKLDDANSKIAMLELRLQQTRKSEEMKGCQ